jgi:hypothetical protein
MMRLACRLPYEGKVFFDEMGRFGLTLPHRFIKIPKHKLMKQLTLLALFALVAFSSCQKDDDGPISCTGLEVIWNNTTPRGDNNWLWLSDEKGAVLEALEANVQRRYRLSTDACAEQYSVTYLQSYRRLIAVGNQMVEVNAYELETYLAIPDGLQFDTAVTETRLLGFAVEGIQSVEAVRWPAESRETFSRDLFIDPAANLLSFLLPIPEGQPAFVSIRANGEATPRSIWIDAATQDGYSFVYDALPQLQSQGPVRLPNNGNWRYEVRGLGANGSAALDYASMPDLVSEQFSALLPPFGAVRAFQLMAWEESFRNGSSFRPIFYNKQVNSLPASISAPNFDFEVQRPARDQISVSIMQGEPQVIQVQFSDPTASAGTYLQWTIVGPPEALANLALPEWPTPALSAIRAGMLEESRNTPLIVTAKAYDSRAPYRQFLEAAARRDANWEASQGMVARSKAE